MSKPRPSCPWCANPSAEDTDRPDLLCRAHEAEYDGLTLNQLDRRDFEQYEEWRDIYG